MEEKANDYTDFHIALAPRVRLIATTVITVKCLKGLFSR